MRDRDAGSEAGQRRAESARRVALHNEESGRLGKTGEQRRCHGTDMRVRIVPPGTIETLRRQRSEPELLRIEARMLAGEDERRLEPALGERLGHGSKLDGFGPGADDQPQIRGMQPSP